MVPHLPAAILIMSDRPHPDKQKAIALTAAAPYDVRVLCYQWRDCLALARKKQISVVVCAIDPGDEVRDAFERAGASVVVAREQAVRIRRDVHQLIERLHKRGIDSQEIALILEVDTQQVRRSIRRLRRE